MGKTPKYKSLRGMPDILPEDTVFIQWIERTAAETFRKFGFKEVRTPILEATEVFTRSIGEDTDIVEKEMYAFPDRKGKSIALRPEGTASVIRAYIEHGLGNQQNISKLYYAGPMFRGERPQKGRQRQFHQIGAESIGVSNPLVDAELIYSLSMILSSLNIKDFTILLNSLGCEKDQEAYKKILSKYLQGKNEDLCDNCKRRMDKNVLRVLDCKRPECKSIVKGAPATIDHLCEGCKNDYEVLKKILKTLDVPFKEKKDLVRGLDYYTGTVFEVVHTSLGAQDAIAAGGRYDDLSYQMGGPRVGATGYAIGIERLLLLIDRESVDLSDKTVFIVPMQEEFNMDAFSLANKLRKDGIACCMDYSGRSFKGQMRRADKEGYAFLIILGEEEKKSKKMLLKDMANGDQKLLSYAEVVEQLK